jgi:hypothetical protein
MATGFPNCGTRTANFVGGCLVPPSTGLSLFMLLLESLDSLSQTIWMWKLTVWLFCPCDAAMIFRCTFSDEHATFELITDLPRVEGSTET